MCGIIAGVSNRPGLGLEIWEGLSRLEYRGYDSFGIAYRARGAEWSEVKQLGAPSEWKGFASISGELSCALGHTRWATHGAVTLKNAHPHNWALDPHALSLVHNGVIENLMHFSSFLSPKFRSALQSETDSEQILALIAQKVEQGVKIVDALREVTDLIEGSYAIIISDLNSDRIWAICKDLPLYVSQAPTHCVYIVSDLAALPQERKTAYALADKEIAQIRSRTFSLYPSNQIPLDNVAGFIPPISNNYEASALRSYLEREIREQENILPQLLSLERLSLPEDLKEIHFVGCGSSFYAAQFCAQFFVQHKICPAMAFVASEFRDCPPMVTRKTALIALSQSGETADVLGALRDRGAHYHSKIALCNRQGSMIEKLVDRTYSLQAGPEYSVASSKVFTAQLAQLSRFLPAPKENAPLVLSQNRLNNILSNPAWKQWAEAFKSASSFLILARGMLLPIAHEGALKLRELTYKQTQAMASGELKHGSLALVDSQTIVIICISCDSSLQKQLVTAQEIYARSGNMWVLLQEGCDRTALPANIRYAMIPPGSPLETGIYFTIPFQIIALELAQILGYSVDRPRNLAKSVTVE